MEFGNIGQHRGGALELTITFVMIEKGTTALFSLLETIILSRIAFSFCLDRQCSFLVIVAAVYPSVNSCTCISYYPGLLQDSYRFTHVTLSLGAQTISRLTLNIKSLHIIPIAKGMLCTSLVAWIAFATRPQPLSPAS
jgi:hypothetical protein